VKVWDVLSGTCSRTIDFKSTVWSLAWCNQKIVAGIRFGVQVADATSGELECNWSMGVRVTSLLALSPPDFAVLCGLSTGLIAWWTVLPTGPNCLRAFAGHTRAVTCMVLLSEGRFASASDDHTIKVRYLDFDREECAQTLRGHRGTVTSLCVLPSGHLASGSWDATIKIWDDRSGGCLFTLPALTHWVSALSVIPNDLLVSGSEDDAVQLWNIKRALL